MKTFFMQKDRSIDSDCGTYHKRGWVHGRILRSIAGVRAAQARDMASFDDSANGVFKLPDDVQVGDVMDFKTYRKNANGLVRTDGYHAYEIVAVETDSIVAEQVEHPRAAFNRQKSAAKADAKAAKAAGVTVAYASAQVGHSIQQQQGA